MWLHFDPIWPWPVILLVALGLVGHAIWAYRADRTGADRMGAWWLIGLRASAALLALLAASRPSLVFPRSVRQTPSVVFLVDVSRSMGLRDQPNGRSRADAVRDILLAADPELERLKEKVEVRWFGFAKDLREPVKDLRELFNGEPDGDQSAYGDSLEALLARTAGERLAAVVLLGDGVNTSGVSPKTVALRVAGQHVPIHCVGVGKETVGESIRDVAARTVLADATVFAKNQLAVRGEFMVQGFPPNQPLTVRLAMDGVEKASREVLVPQGSDRIHVELAAIADRPGDTKLTLSADPQPNELLPGNNATSTFVSVLEGGISVLYIEGKYRFWEPKYLRWALDQSPDIELTQLHLLDVHGKETALDSQSLEAFDVVVLGDVHSNRFGKEQLVLLRDRVLKGGAGLLMLGGYESFGPGLWHETALADVLPVEMHPADAQYQRPLKVVPTTTGLRHFVLQLRPSASESQAAWEKLRPLDGGSAWRREKPGALLLAATPEAVPLLAAQDVGRGRAIAFAGDTTWRWRNDDEGIRNHARFWRQLVLWLAHKETVEGSQIHVRLDRRRLAAGNRLPIEVKVEDSAGLPIQGAVVQAVVETPDATRIPVELIRRDDRYEGVFWQTQVPGDYRLEVAATAEGNSLGRREVRFLTYSDDAEMRQLNADLDSLRNLAETTAGQFFFPEQFPKLVEMLASKDLNQEITQPVKERLWDRWQFLVLFIVLVAAEWVARKRGGLP